MSPGDILAVLSELILLASALFVVYSALNLRRVLIDGPYRSRALWTAIGALSVVSFIGAGYVDNIFGNTPTTLTGVVVEDVFWGFTFLGLYGWVVVNANVAIKADFFNRDVAGWNRGGRIIAPGLVAATYVLVSLPPWWLPSSVVNSSLLNDLINAIFFGVILYAAVVLTVTYVRIRDRTIKKYTKWVVLSVLSVFLALVFPVPEVTLALALCWAYFSYRSVRSLAIRTKSLG